MTGSMAGAGRKLVVVVLWCPVMAQAGIYICKDGGGRTLTSDRPIPECADRVMREYSDKGVLKREIAAPLTPEQKQQLEAQRRQRQAEEEALAERRRSDRALLARFHNEQEIEAARQRESATLSNLIVQQKAALHVARKDWSAADGNKPRQQLLGERVQEIDKSLRDSEGDLVQLNAKFDGMLKRYRELAGSALP
ncbi:DUF4124 domain-containing protein [uncultured Oxalicibacterium sp.]|uniref:DUF4124 domain-containing protein n=1 Tax=uncultured Oxalicibacterium sp. TaxID=1168540 RepID=UPI0025EFAC15|nr:DUF4124 domain-containing protein [uncultured Oxalicibacterium sp.]